jgi:GNAT superfamily N-acetyltransferase
MEPWSDDRVWDAADAWRWVPPAARKLKGANFELAVTPGSYALSFAYGFRAGEGVDAERALEDLHTKVVALGGTGINLQVTSRTRPQDLAERLLRRGYELKEDAEVLAWELLDARDGPRIPKFRSVQGVTVREVSNDDEYAGFLALSKPIFDEPTPSEESRLAFRREFHRQLREQGHSERFVAWAADRPIGRAGMEMVDDVARLWGTGVLPEHRGKGVYGLLVQARCEEAIRRGGQLALVSARKGTSGPILKHHGFRAMGTTRLYQARWDPSYPSDGSR